MTVEVAVVAVVAGLVAGTLIGAIGIGGVLLVPALVLVAGLGVEEATPIASMSFLFTGAAGTLVYARNDRIDWAPVVWLLGGAVPGTVAGAATNVALAPAVLTGLVAVLLAAAAVRALLPRVIMRSSGERFLPTGALVAIGAVVGFGSALTGTGGPVLLIPIMLLAGGGLLVTIAASQPLQVPIAVTATAAFAAYGVIDWGLGLLLGIAQVGGVVAGAALARRLPVAALRMLVGVALAGSAAAMAVEALAG